MFALNSIEAISKHRKAAMKLSQKNFLGPSDPVISILTCCIIMTTSDFIDLDEPKRAEEAQTAYANLLHRWAVFIVCYHIIFQYVMFCAYIPDIWGVKTMPTLNLCSESPCLPAPMPGNSQRWRPACIIGWNFKRTLKEQIQLHIKSFFVFKTMCFK